jgi:GTPase
VAVVGRPNVGKSSLVNALLREERTIVDPAPGTTRDPVDSYLEIEGGAVLRLVDTAGLRRRVQIKDPIEYFGFLRSHRTLARVDAAVLVIDISEGVTGHDQRIAEEIVEAGRACVVALNKWDLLGDEPTDRVRAERAVTEKLRFISWATIVRTSALTGRGVERVAPALLSAVASHRRRVPTAAVNHIVQTAQERRPHPRTGGRSVRILYAVQAKVAPPRVLLFSTGRIEPSYLRYLENRLRASESFAGTPVVLEVRHRTRRQLES